MVPRGRVYRYPPGRNMPDGPMPGAMLPGYEMGGMPMRDAGIAQPVPITALASALANATPEQQRTVCCFDTNFIVSLCQSVNQCCETFHV